MWRIIPEPDSMSNNRKNRAKSSPKTTFKKAVLSTADIAGAYQNGIQALLPEHRKGLKNGQSASGSVDIDSALAKKLPNDHRWDYGMGLPKGQKAEKVLWLEVHHAASGETERVIRKLTALKDWLQTNSPQLASMERVFVWQLSNVENNPNDRRKRNQLAAKHGLRRVQGMLDLAAI